MKLKTIVVLCIYELFLTATATDNRDILKPMIDLIELDYTDICEQRASASWEELIGSPKGLSQKMERDKSFGIFSQNSLMDIQNTLNLTYVNLPIDGILKRKVELFQLQRNVTTNDWVKLVEFGNTAQHELRFATNYDCGNRANCSLKEFHKAYRNEQNVETLARMKLSWEKNLPDFDRYVEQILPILRNAPKGYASVEEYWHSLVEYEGALWKARELWEKIKPLYIKLQNYATLKLNEESSVGDTLPLHILKTLNGDDWSNVFELLIPTYPHHYQDVYGNLESKNLGGLRAFKAAEKLIKELNLGEIKPEIWSESIFNATCPSTLVDWCEPNKLRVITCNHASISNYLDAHETAMKIIYEQTMASISNNSYILRKAPRYSAIYEGIPGFISMLALSPHSLDRNELLSIEVFNYNADHHRLILQLLLALRDLPKLNYYLAVDEWRLKVLKEGIPQSQAASNWAQYRREFSLLNSTGVELLADPYVVFNEPFLGKFMGLVLKYQIYQSFAMELNSEESDLVQHVASKSDRLVKVMKQGFRSKWPQLVGELLKKGENDVNSTSLLEYYRRLDAYLPDVGIQPKK